MLVAVLVSSPARVRAAETDASARALAIQLFDEAQDLLGKNRVAEACPKLAESYRLDPQLGALIHLADCYERNGQLASAWGAFREAEEIAQKREDERATMARDRAAALSPRLSKLVVQMSSNTGLPGVTLLRDGAVVAPVMWGAAAPIDPGKHRLEVRAPGYKSWQGEVLIEQEGSTLTMDVARLQPEVAAPPVAAAAPVVAVSEPSPASDTPPGQTQRIGAMALGGVGVVALGIGTYLGLSASSSNSDSKAQCSDNNRCTPEGKELRASAQSKALASTIVVSVGVGALIGAGVLWFTAPKSESKAAHRKAPPRWALAPKNDAWGLELNHAF